MQGLACMYAPNMDLNCFTLVNQSWTTQVPLLVEHTPACWRFEHRHLPGSFCLWSLQPSPTVFQGAPVTAAKSEASNLLAEVDAVLTT